MSHMDPEVELSLLQRRFPEIEIADCGKLYQDYFCARKLKTHTYEGRLFLTEKYLLFVSTFSDANELDVSISYSDVRGVVARQRSIISTVEVSLDDKQEHFTNFYKLGRVVSALRKMLPKGVVSEVKESGSLKRFSRLVSVPASTRYPHSPTPSPLLSPVPSSLPVSPENRVEEIRPKVAFCPFFAKCGFCPRQPLCKLDHTLATSAGSVPGSQDTLAAAAPTSAGVKSSGRRKHADKHTKYLGSPKRFHALDNGEEGASLELPGLANESGKLDRELSNASPSYNRSLSTPARVLTFDPSSESAQPPATPEGELQPEADTSGGSNEGKEEGSEMKSPAGVHVDSAGGTAANGRLGDQKESSISSEVSPAAVAERLSVEESTLSEKPLDVQSTTQDQSPETPSDKTTPQEPPEVPKAFDFLTKLPRQHSDPGQDPQPEGEDEKTVSDTSQKGGVFVFTASDPTSPDQVPVKRKNAAVGFCFSPAEERGGEGLGGGAVPPKGLGEEDMAVLAQQLGLESDNDNDSLQGDLDLDSQQKLLDSFGKGKGAVPPPPFISPPLPRPPSKSPTDPDKKAEGAEGGYKRQPCMYFLSGYCRNGPNCPQYHGDGLESYQDLDSDTEESELSGYGQVALPSKLKVFSAAAAGRGDINSGDKIILSPQILIACELKEISYPMAFRLEHLGSGRLVHAGVLEFTSPFPDAAYVPQWMLEHLQAKDGDEISFKHVDLPKGTFVRLQPVSSAWLGIAYDRRMAMMEFQLRNFQTLTEGTKVTLTYELNKYTLKVLECKPAKGISIVDADITTDIVEPADFNRFHSIEEGQAEHIGLEETLKCSVPANSYRHFVLLSLPGQPLPSRLRVVVSRESGDPDLFLSQTAAAPTQKRYTWCNQDVGDSVFHLSTDEKEYDISKPLYMGVVSLCEETEFTVCLHREDTLAAAQARQKSPATHPYGQTLRTTDPHNPASHPSPTSPDKGLDHTDGVVTALPAGHERCSYCGTVMPSLRLLMHERHCAQSTFKCPICKACLPKAAEKKHHFIAHELLACECGKEFTQSALHHHQLTDCTKRSVKCSFKWCNLSFPMDQLHEHENLCGRKEVPCPICKEEVTQLELEMHLQAFHAIDTEKLDWGKPLGGQLVAVKPKEPKFTCSCGSNFDFQDDFQVHQLTECPMRRVVEDTLTQTDSKVDIVG